MAEKLVLLSKGSGVPKIAVEIGRAQFGTYEVLLWDATAKDWQVVGKGANFDDIADEFPLGKLAALNERLLRWDLIMSAPTAGESYKARVTITQGPDVVPGGQHSYEGEIKQNPKIIMDMVKVLVR
jgi:hypothetical protein